MRKCPICGTEATWTETRFLLHIMNHLDMAGVGVLRILNERIRQKEVEGWTAEHDTQHTKGELSIAAACYAVNKLPPPYVRVVEDTVDAWPWHDECDKREKHDRERSLEIAGALIASEIDRIKAAE